MPALSREQASGFSRLALKGLSAEYPNKPEHVMAGLGDVKAPRALHPAFYGSYDWHSSVHGHWMMLARDLLRPSSPTCRRGRRFGPLLAGHLSAENFKVEVEYFDRKESRSFERPYGWAWLLKLAEELQGWDDPNARTWSRDLRPLADVVVARYLEFFPKQTYPIRTGVHPNTAFGLLFAHDYARTVEGTRLTGAGRGAGPGLLHGADSDAPARWEPSERGLLLAEPGRGGPDAARVLPSGGVPYMVRKQLSLPGAARGEPKAALHARHRHRPDGPASWCTWTG